MKRRISQKLVGIALEADRALLAEVAPADDGKIRMVAGAEFVFPPGVGLDQPAVLGQALRRFLRQHGINRRQAVIGLPARSLITRRCALPPADIDTTLAGLRLQAEGAFAGQTNEVVVDYFGPVDGSRMAEGLLVATSRALVEQCRLMMAAAHMRLVAVTATVPSLGELAGAPGVDGLVVNVGATGIDLFFNRDGVPVELRHAGSVMPEKKLAGLLAAEILRSLVAHGSTAAETSKSRPVVIWTQTAEHDHLAADLQTNLGLGVTLPDLRNVLGGSTADMQRAAPAAAVALAASVHRLPVDFLHSRLTPPRVKAPRRRMAQATALAAAVLLAVAAAAYNLHQRREDLAAAQMQLAKIRPDVKKAKQALKRLMYARHWHPGAPVLLKPFRSLTEAFPDSGSIYATSLSLRDNGRGELTGEAGSEAQVLELRDSMHKTGGLSNISVRDVRQLGIRGRRYTFIISFEFRR